MIKLKSLLIEEEAPSILIPRNVEERKEKLKRIHWRRVLKYIKDGCQGDLLLQGTQLEFLPENLFSVGGNLDLIGSKIKKLPDNLKKIGGSLWLDVTLIEYLPENLTIGWKLILTHSKIKKLPDNLSIGKDLYLYNTLLSKKYTVDEIRKMVKHIGGNIYI
jgi:hypothetical protein